MRPWFREKKWKKAKSTPPLADWPWKMYFKNTSPLSVKFASPLRDPTQAWMKMNQGRWKVWVHAKTYYIRNQFARIFLQKTDLYCCSPKCSNSSASLSLDSDRPAMPALCTGHICPIPSLHKTPKLHAQSKLKRLNIVALLPVQWTKTNFMWEQKSEDGEWILVWRRDNVYLACDSLAYIPLAAGVHPAHLNPNKKMHKHTKHIGRMWDVGGHVQWGARIHRYFFAQRYMCPWTMRRGTSPPLCADGQIRTWCCWARHEPLQPRRQVQHQGLLGTLVLAASPSPSSWSASVGCGNQKAVSWALVETLF